MLLFKEIKYDCEAKESEIEIILMMKGSFLEAGVKN
jgi:hypothetical protein